MTGLNSEEINFVSGGCVFVINSLTLVMNHTMNVYLKEEGAHCVDLCAQLKLDIDEKSNQTCIAQCIPPITEKRLYNFQLGLGLGLIFCWAGSLGALGVINRKIV